MMLRLLFPLLFLATLCHADYLDDAETFFVQVGDTQLFCRKMGSGSPLVVLHGGPGMTQDYLLPHMQQLAENNLVIFYDQRGCGRSHTSIDTSTINLRNYVEDLDQIRQSLNVDKISILGHSWGGFLAMHYAIAHPQAVDKLILSNSIPASSEDLSLFQAEWLHRMTPYMGELNEIHNDPEFEKGNPELIERLHRLMFRTYCYDPNKAELLNLHLTPTAALDGARVFSLIHQSLFTQPYTLFYDLYTLNLPTLIIHGDSDPIPAQTAFAIHNHITSSTYILMENCGHFPYIEAPELYFDHIQHFLNPTEPDQTKTDPSESLCEPK